MELTDFSVLSFDCYGTLIDWETGLQAALAPLLARVGRSPPVDDLLEAFGRLESAQQAATPTLRYPELLARVHLGLARELGAAPHEGEAEAFGRSVGDWPAFADSPEALRYLQRHFRLVILSNVDRASFRRSEARLGVSFDRVFTAEEIGSYKPDPRNFEHLIVRLAAEGVARRSILHTAESLFHDLTPAERLGLASCWIHRRAGKRGHGATRAPAAQPRHDFRFTSLGALAEAHRTALAQASAPG